METKQYAAIDLKSFYASVECVERGLNPLTTHLVVADASRTEKTICLAVSPSLKAHGVPGRPRLFEVVQKVKKVNEARKRKAGGHTFIGSSVNAEELKSNSSLELSYIVATPRMAYYMQYSARIYEIYLKYFAPEDIHVYSIDEVMIDLTPYRKTYSLSSYELVKKVIQEVKEGTGITATAGIGSNLYLAKVAMDIKAKHIEEDIDGVRIAELDEMSYRKEMWPHEPITDFWRVGRGYAKRLAQNGMFTMGDVARCSLGSEKEFHNEDLLYQIFGVNAELLIDHAWGLEPCTIADIKAYQPENHSIGSGQVLHSPYSYEKAELVIREMTDLLVLELVDKSLVTSQVILTVGYDIENLKDREIMKKYRGEITLDRYGRQKPKSAHGSLSLKEPTSSTQELLEAVKELFEQIVNPDLWIRRLNVTFGKVELAHRVKQDKPFCQMDLFTDYQALEEEKKKREVKLAREKSIQKAVIDIKKKYGKNAILKGMNLEEGATGRLRNNQIGGHKA